MSIVYSKGYYGLGGNLAVLASSMMLAEEIGSHVIVDWSESPMSAPGLDGFATLFEYEGNLQSVSCLDKEPKTLKNVFPAEWAPFLGKSTKNSKTSINLTRQMPEEAREHFARTTPSYVYVVSRDGRDWFDSSLSEKFSEYLNGLRMKPEIASELKKLRSQLNINERTVGVHFRHGNGEKGVVPPSFEWFCARISEYLDSGSFDKVMIASDCLAATIAFESRFPGRTVRMDKSFAPIGKGGLHMVSDIEKSLQNAESWFEMKLLSYSGAVLGSRSFFAGVATKMANVEARKKSTAYVPKLRSFIPSDGQIEASKSPWLMGILGKEIDLFDGLYWSHNGFDDITISYLGENLFSGNESNIDFYLQEIKQKLVSHRLY